MNIILDTHIFLWWLTDNRALSTTSRKEIALVTNKIYVSSATIWEIAIKKAIGKLIAPDDLEMELAANAFLPLHITPSHAILAGSLPFNHTDPFDRMLIAQSKLENFTLLTNDKNLHAYSANIMQN